MNAGQYEGIVGRLDAILAKMPAVPQPDTKPLTEAARFECSSCSFATTSHVRMGGHEVVTGHVMNRTSDQHLVPVAGPMRVVRSSEPPMVAAVMSTALYTLLTVLDRWIEGARSNHDGFGHRGEPVDGECWTRFHPSDIRNMINDAARELGLTEFPLPEKPKEDQVR